MFNPSKLRVTFSAGARREGPLYPRRYTLTHSDRTGDLFLTIGPDYDERALRALQVRLERDEVLGEWIRSEGGPTLMLHMMAQGGVPLFGTAAMRCAIFRRYRDLVLDALRYADQDLSRAHPDLERAPIVACFHWRRGRRECESWGLWGEPN